MPCNAGSYTATETATGYTASAWGGDCAANGTVTLALGDSKTCTITNDDLAPKLTLVKTVVNNNGGTMMADDFARNIDGSAVAGHGGDAERGLAHGERDNPNRLHGVGLGRRLRGERHDNVAPGDNKTCTITNDDMQPTLTVVKTVRQQQRRDAVANDFPLFVDATAVTGTRQ